MKTLLRLFSRIFLSIGIAGICVVTLVVLFANSRLPSIENLADIRLQVPLHIYTIDGKLIGEYGEKRRSPIKIDDVPEQFISAILATEDTRFYEHPGVDLRGLARASVHLITHGKKEQGASTITMQVARNFYLTRKKTYARKLNEVLLALKIESQLTKDKILELYLNKIYFGKRAYGVQAASYVYFGKSIQDLTLAQMALLAGLPQAPSALNPLNNPEGSLKRRNHVLNRMLTEGFVSQKAFDVAIKEPMTAKYHGRPLEADAPYAAEMARVWLLEKYGNDVYTQGLEVYTTIDSRLQNVAHETVQEGILSYEKRHGYRGAAGRVSIQSPLSKNKWEELLLPYQALDKLMPAIVTHTESNVFKATLGTGQSISVGLEGYRWARKRIDDVYLGAEPKQATDVVKVGDVIYVEADKSNWKLSQIPKVSSALVALNPKNGSIISVVGGYDFRLSNFNRATQAYRQPGSNFKPLVYAAALENGFTPASIINDAPIVFNDPTLEGTWRPQNDTRKFYGPTRLRVGLTKSRNLVSIRILQAMGLKKAIQTLEKFGFEAQRLPHGLSLALGTVNVTPLEMATSYAAFSNGGYKITPYIVSHVESASGKIIYQANPPVACEHCSENTFNEVDVLNGEEGPQQAPSAVSKQTAYMMDSILKDAIKTGTGRKARALNRADIAGKTGTTNQQIDAWYSGYHPSIVTSVWVGFDEPKTLKEYGAQAALPIWMTFMEEALKGKPETMIPEPEGLVMVKIDPHTGLLARPDQSDAIFELFSENNAPQEIAPYVSNDQEVNMAPSSSGEALF